MSNEIAGLGAQIGETAKRAISVIERKSVEGVPISPPRAMAEVMLGDGAAGLKRLSNILPAQTGQEEVYRHHGPEFNGQMGRVLIAVTVIQIENIIRTSAIDLNMFCTRFTNTLIGTRFNGLQTKPEPLPISTHEWKGVVETAHYDKTLATFLKQRRILPKLLRDGLSTIVVNRTKYAEYLTASLIDEYEKAVQSVIDVQMSSSQPIRTTK